MKNLLAILILLFVNTLSLSAYSMSVGDSVRMVASGVAVREAKTTSSKQVGKRLSLGEIGVVVKAPVAGTKYIWTKIQWNNGATGWTPNPKNGYYYYEKPTTYSPGKYNESYEEITDTTPTLRWEKIDGVVNYRIALRDVETDELIIDENIDGSLTSYTAPTLTKGHRYYWDLVPRDSDGDMGIWAKSRYFKIKDNSSSDDFYISNFKMNPTGTFNENDSFTLYATQKYSGNSSNALRPYMGFYFSKDTTFDKNDDDYLGEVRTYARDGHNEYEAKLESVHIPKGTKAGKYYIIAVANYKNTGEFAYQANTLTKNCL